MKEKDFYNIGITVVVLGLLLPLKELLCQDIKSPVIIKESPKTALEYIKSGKTKPKEETELPTGENKNNSGIPKNTIYNYELTKQIRNFNVQRAKVETDLWLLAQQNIDNIPNAFLVPTRHETFRFYQNIMASQEMPIGIRPHNPWGGILRASPRAVAQTFGLLEDFSPIIEYEIQHDSRVQILIYTGNSELITIFFDSMQPAGSYSIEWDLKDGEGNNMPNGDYIAEVIIDNQRIVKKVIKIPDPWAWELPENPLD